MRLETLAKRLAERCNTPELEQVILGEKDASVLPTGCMLWTGAKTRPEKSDWKLRMNRNGAGHVSARMVQEEPYPTIKYEGKRHLVQRLIFQLIANPGFEFRMKRTCANSLCVNPLHWDAIPLEKKAEEGPPEIPEITSEWTEESVIEMLEMILGDVPPPSNWDEVINHIDMEGAPPTLVREGLIQLNKEHLT